MCYLIQDKETGHNHVKCFYFVAFSRNTKQGKKHSEEVRDVYNLQNEPQKELYPG